LIRPRHGACWIAAVSRAANSRAPRFLWPRSPADTPQVRGFCDALVPGGGLTRVPVEPPPWAQPENCTDNVSTMVERHGGRAQNGWRIFESLPHVVLEAEFHVIWIAADGKALDVTPSPVPGATLFLSDPDLRYEGRQIDNRRMALRPDPLIDDYIAAAEAFFEVTNRGALAYVHGDIEFTPEMARIIERRERLQLALRHKYHKPPPPPPRRRRRR
jgi:hypothetical protein